MTWFSYLHQLLGLVFEVIHTNCGLRNADCWIFKPSTDPSAASNYSETRIAHRDEERRTSTVYEEKRSLFGIHFLHGGPVILFRNDLLSINLHDHILRFNRQTKKRLFKMLCWMSWNPNLFYGLLRAFKGDNLPLPKRLLDYPVIPSVSYNILTFYTMIS